MAKHIYDENGKYKGKILSDEEHRKKRYGGGGVDIYKKCKGCKNKFLNNSYKNLRQKEVQIYDGSWWFYCDKCLPHWYYSSRFILIWIIIYFPIGFYGLYKRRVNSIQIKKWAKQKNNTIY